MHLFFRSIKIFFGVCLLPLCWALSTVMVSLILRSSGEAICIFSGFCAGSLLVLLRGMTGKLYIFVHEMNHVLWSLLSSIPVKKIALSKTGGHVVVERENLFVALAPYFFPLPVLVLALIHLLIRGIGIRYAIVGYVEYVLFGFFLGWHVVTSLQIIIYGQQEIFRIGLFFSLSLIYALFFFWSGLFLSLLISDFYLADFFALSYKKIISGYYHCFQYTLQQLI